MYTQTLYVVGLGTLLAACGGGANTEATDAQAAAQATALSKTYAVNSEATTLGWMGSKLTGSSHNGTIQVSEGSLSVENDTLTAGTFTIDMNTITNLDLEDQESNQKLVGHLTSPDFFDVAAHSVSTFEITKAEPMAQADAEGNNYSISGNLTIKGIEKNITFPAKFSATQDQANLSAKFSIDRTQWDVRYGSDKFFDDLKDNVISDIIEYDLSLSAAAKQ
jgi:polyisoprenoid-binding protein YceI